MSENRELDAKVAEIIGRPFRQPTHGWCCTCQHCGHANDHHHNCEYSSDWAAAGEVLDWLDTRKDVIEVITRHYVRMRWQVTLVLHSRDVVKTAPTGPEAVCRAVIAAFGGEE